MAHTSDTLVGRDEELTRFATALGVLPAHDGTPAPRPWVVLLSGDAGVGKTRVLEELGGLARADGWLVLAGHCLDFGTSALPYLPFSEVLARLDKELPEVVEQVAEVRPSLTRLRPGRRMLSAHGAVDDESAALDRADLFEGMFDLLEAAAEKAPVLLMVEDSHWADQSTRDLLGYLFTRPFEGPVSIVASYRSDDLHRRHPLRRQVAEWARIQGVERFGLEPLPDSDVRTLVAELEAVGGPRLDERQVADVVDRSEGNAFFVEELVASGTGPTRWIPEDLADVLLVRLDRLDERGRQVARAASVAGRRVSHDLLGTTTALAGDDFDEGVRQAVEMNVLVVDDGRYAFRHALLGEAVYDDLLPGERVRLHGRFCDVLREHPELGTAAELARHARRAQRFDAAAAAMIQAGQEAMAIGGPDEAAEHFQHALELLADSERRQRLGLDLSEVAVWTADALTASGHAERGAAVLGEHVQQLPADSSDAARARLLSAYAGRLLPVETELWHAWFGGRIRLAALTIGAICRALPQTAATERETWMAHVDRLHADGITALGNHSGRRGWGIEGRSWLKRLDAESLRARWLAGVDPPPLEELLEAWAECEQLFEEFDHVHELAQVRTTLAGIHRAVGDRAESRRLGDLAREAAYRLAARPLLDELVEIGSTPARAGAASDALTPREAEILALVAEGRSNGEIGKQLFITTKTVSVHVSNILGKLGASGRTEAAAIARRRGLLDRP